MNQQPEALRLADLMEQQPWPLPSERIQVADELRRLHAENEALRAAAANPIVSEFVREVQTGLAGKDREIERLNRALRYEQDRSGRIGTHGPGCHLWGHRHHECLEREYQELLKALKCLLEMGHAKAGDLARNAIAKAEVQHV